MFFKAAFWSKGLQTGTRDDKGFSLHAESEQNETKKKQNPSNLKKHNDYLLGCFYYRSSMKRNFHPFTYFEEKERKSSSIDFGIQ